MLKDLHFRNIQISLPQLTSDLKSISILCTLSHKKKKNHNLPPSKNTLPQKKKRPRFPRMVKMAARSRL